MERLILKCASIRKGICSFTVFCISNKTKRSVQSKSLWQQGAPGFSSFHPGWKASWPVLLSCLYLLLGTCIKSYESEQSSTIQHLSNHYDLSFLRHWEKCINLNPECCSSANIGRKQSWPSVSAEKVRTLLLLILSLLVQVVAATGNLIKPLIQALLDSPAILL